MSKFIIEFDSVNMFVFKINWKIFCKWVIVRVWVRDGVISDSFYSNKIK